MPLAAFDLDGTLVDQVGAARIWTEELCARWELPEDEVDRTAKAPAEVGSRKPESAIFYALARKLNCPLDGWMVGDSLELDIAGGVAVGLKTAWITTAPEGTNAEMTITAPSVAEAVRLILADH